MALKGILIVTAIVLLYLLYRLFLRRLFFETTYHRVTLEALERYFAAFHTAGYRSVMAITHRKTEYFVQFLQVRSKEDDKKLEMLFGFPEAEWSVKFFPHIKNILSEHRIEYYPVETNENLGDQTKMIYVRCGSNRDKATLISKLVLFDVFNLEENDLYDIWFSDTGLLRKKNCCNYSSCFDHEAHRADGGVPISTTTIGRAAVIVGYLAGTVVGLLRTNRDK